MIGYIILIRLLFEFLWLLIADVRNGFVDFVKFMFHWFCLLGLGLCRGIPLLFVLVSFFVGVSVLFLLNCRWLACFVIEAVGSC